MTNRIGYIGRRRLEGFGVSYVERLEDNSSDEIFDLRMIHRGPEMRWYFCFAHSQNSDKQTIFSPQSISVTHRSKPSNDFHFQQRQIYLNQSVLFVIRSPHYTDLLLQNPHQYLITNEINVFNPISPTMTNTWIHRNDFILFQTLLLSDFTLRLISSSIGCTDMHRMLFFLSANYLMTYTTRLTVDDLA